MGLAATCRPLPMFSAVRSTRDAVVATQDYIRTVYHCTLKTSAENIMRTGFRFPSENDAHEKGLKLGTAAYFGEHPDYCVHEALNSLAGDDEEARRKKKSELGLLQARIRMGRTLSLGDYGVGVKEGFRGLSAKEYESRTESLTNNLVKLFGFDTITIF